MCKLHFADCIFLTSFDCSLQSLQFEQPTLKMSFDKSFSRDSFYSHNYYQKALQLSNFIFPELQVQMKNIVLYLNSSLKNRYVDQARDECYYITLSPHFFEMSLQNPEKYSLNTVDCHFVASEVEDRNIIYLESQEHY